jgi:uncharacterized delta-60 repeat protein
MAIERLTLLGESCSAARLFPRALLRWGSTALMCWVVFASAHIAQAGVNLWTSHGPYGGSVRTLAIDPHTPSTLYAGTYGAGNGTDGVFQSTDSGAHWTTTGLTNQSFVLALAIAPDTPSTLYAGAISGGVFQSTDSGAHWSAITTGLTNQAIVALAIDPDTPSTLYAGTATEGVFQSTDSGAHWSAINTGLPAQSVVALAIDPHTPSTLYAGTAGGGVFESTDSGGHWSAINTALTDQSVWALAIDPSTPSTLYAGTAGGGVFDIEQVTPLCVADCNSDGQVTVDEIVTLVNIALGTEHVADCPNGLPPGTTDATVNVAMIILAVNNALVGCPVPHTPTSTNTPATTPTSMPTQTVTNTPTESPTLTPVSTPTNRPTQTPSSTSTATPTNTPSGTPTVSITPAPSVSATLSNTATVTKSGTPTRTSTSTRTPSRTWSPTLTLPPTHTPTPTSNGTSTWTPTRTRTATPTSSPNPTPTSTRTGCVSALEPSYVWYPCFGGSFSGCFDVVAPSDCCWAATSSSTVAQVTSGGSGCGDGRVCYSSSVGECDMNYQITGTITVGGQSFVVRYPQEPTPQVPTPENTPTCPPSQFTPSPAQNPGDLDPRFGVNGVALTSFGSHSSAEAAAVVIQPDAKIVVAGSASPDGLYSRFGVVRYQPDGTLDDGFGAHGVVTTVIGSNHAIPGAVVAQPDGKLVVAGGTYDPFEFALVRYTADGSLDASFGVSGIAHTIRDPGAGEVSALVRLADGRLVVAGQLGFDLLVRRYLDNGAFDPTFGTDGEVTVSTKGCSVGCAINGLALQPDGRIVAAGATWKPESGYAFLLLRFAPDGSLDQSFGTGGIVITPVGGSAAARAVVVQPNGKIVADGWADSGFALVRYNADGSLDGGFGRGGMVVESGGDSLQALVLQPDGKLVAAGSSYYYGPFALARFNDDGSLDSTFGNNGSVYSQFRWLNCYGAAGEATSVAIDADHNLVVAGALDSPGGLLSFAVARYLGSPASSGTPSTPSTGARDAGPMNNPVQPCSRAGKFRPLRTGPLLVGVTP